MRAEMKTMIDGILKITKDEMVKGDLLARFFVGKDDELKIIGAPMGDDSEKDMVARAVRELSVDADFVIFISEIWMIKAKHAEDFQNNRAKYKNVYEHPHREEKLMIQVETSDGGMEMGLAKILEDRTLGEVEWIPPKSFGGFGGRFTNFITSSKPMH